MSLQFNSLFDFLYLVHRQLLNTENKDLKKALAQAQRHVQASATVNADIGESAMREHARLAEDLKLVQRELRDKDNKLSLVSL